MTNSMLKLEIMTDATVARTRTTLNHTKVQLIRAFIEATIDLIQDHEVVTGTTDTKTSFHHIRIPRCSENSGHPLINNTHRVGCQDKLFNSLWATIPLNLGHTVQIEVTTNSHRWSSALFNHSGAESSIPTEILIKGIESTNRITSPINFTHKTIVINMVIQATKSRCRIRAGLTNPIQSATCTQHRLRGLNQVTSVILKDSPTKINRGSKLQKMTRITNIRIIRSHLQRQENPRW